MTGREYTIAEIEAGIHRALQTGEVAVVPSLLALLAVQAPRRAEAIRETIRLADGGKS